MIKRIEGWIERNPGIVFVMVFLIIALHESIADLIMN